MGKGSDTNDVVVVPPPPRFCGSCRFTLVVMLFTAITLTMLLRFNFSIALVCMVFVNETDTTGERHLEREFDWDTATTANLIGAYFYGYVCTQIVGGWLCKRVGEKPVILWSMVALTISTLLVPLMARLDVWALFSVRFVQGFITGLVMPAIYTSLYTWSSPVERTTLMAITFAGYPVGNMITFPLSGLLCHTGVDGGWPMVFYVPGAICAVWTVTYYFLVTTSPEDHPRISAEEKEYLREYSCKNLNESSNDKRSPPPVPWIPALMSVPIHALWIVQFCSLCVFYVLALNFPIFIAQISDLGIIENGMLSGVLFVGMFLMTFTGQLSDFLHNRYHISENVLRKSLNTIGMLTSSVLLCIIPYLPEGIGSVLVLSLSAAFMQITFSAGYFVSHADLVGQFSGILFGFTNTMGQFSGFIAPLFIAALVQEETQEEWQIVFYLSAAIGAFGGLVYLFLGSNTLQKWAEVKDEEEEEDDNNNNNDVPLSSSELSSESSSAKTKTKTETAAKLRVFAISSRMIDEA